MTKNELFIHCLRIELTHVRQYEKYHKRAALTKNHELQIFHLTRKRDYEHWGNGLDWCIETFQQISLHPEDSPLLAKIKERSINFLKENAPNKKGITISLIKLIIEKEK